MPSSSPERLQSSVLRRWLRGARALRGRQFPPSRLQRRRVLLQLEALEPRLNLSSLPTVQFNATSYSVNEGTSSATIGVSLTSTMPSQLVTVQYSTSDGTAKAGTDYTTTDGTMTFQAGTVVKTQFFNIPLLDDNLVNESNPETVQLTLSDPTNATLGRFSTAVLQINEDGDGGSNLPPVTVPTPCPDDG